MALRAMRDWWKALLDAEAAASRNRFRMTPGSGIRHCSAGRAHRKGRRELQIGNGNLRGVDQLLGVAQDQNVVGSDLPGGGVEQVGRDHRQVSRRQLHRDPVQDNGEGPLLHQNQLKAVVPVGAAPVRRLPLKMGNAEILLGLFPEGHGDAAADGHRLPSFRK